ncbi:MAG: MBL fold metallo-hydrolase [Anaerolineae bacterium]|jgi:glyoxylase-like metal-dependent hydrolase (beta-lactamase superfamily II)
MEIVPNVHLVPGMRGANVYLLLGSTLTLVDTGMPGSEEAILAYIDSLGLDAGDLARMVITHHHLDHVGGIAAMKRRTAALVLAHPDDAGLISGEQSPPPASSPLMRFLFWLVAPLMPTLEPVPVDVTVQDGERLDLLGGATVVHVPGHTPGSIALHFPAERLLICGDTIDHRRGRLGPPPKPFTEDMDQALASIRRMSELEFDVLCPGHGAPIVGGADQQVRALVQALA